MSSLSSYPTKAFKESQKFLIRDPATGSFSYVLGSDLVSYITPSLNYVRSETTRLAAENENYRVGNLVQTTGATSVGDGQAALYLVVAAGEGDFPMLNGNELLVIAGDEFLREQLASNAAGDGSDLVAHTGTSDTVTQAFKKRVTSLPDITSLYSLNTAALVDGQQFHMTGWRTGSDLGGGVLVYDASRTKSDHDGITVFSLTVPAPPSFSDSDVAAYQDGSGETDPGGSGCLVKDLQGRNFVTVHEAGISVDGTGDWKIPAENALSAVGGLALDVGVMQVSTLKTVGNQRVSGPGRDLSTIRTTGFVTYNGIKHTFGTINDANRNLAQVVTLGGFTIDCQTAEPTTQGWLITRKVYADDIYVKDATDSGIYFRSVDQNLEAPYFCILQSVWSKFNGGAGLKITENCNANNFSNCQFDSNGTDGVITQIVGNGQPAALYGNRFEGGQTSFNQQNGINFAFGSEMFAEDVYAEFNSQVDGGNPKTGAYKNLRLGANVSRCWVNLGSQGTSTGFEDVVDLNTVANNFVAIGGQVLSSWDKLVLGYEGVGAGRDIILNGGGGAIHRVTFREGTQSIFRITYDGTAGNPGNLLKIEASSLGDSNFDVTIFELGQGGVINTTANYQRNGTRILTSQQAAIADSVGGDEQAKINSILAALRTHGLIAT